VTRRPSSLSSFACPAFSLHRARAWHPLRQRGCDASRTPFPVIAYSQSVSQSHRWAFLTCSKSFILCWILARPLSNDFCLNISLEERVRSEGRERVRRRGQARRLTISLTLLGARDLPSLRAKAPFRMKETRGSSGRIQYPLQNYSLLECFASFGDAQPETDLMLRREQERERESRQSETDRGEGGSTSLSISSNLCWKRSSSSSLRCASSSV
jgi:hypothetical protein